jgi:hypothetical protein
VGYGCEARFHFDGEPRIAIATEIDQEIDGTAPVERSGRFSQVRMRIAGNRASQRGATCDDYQRHSGSAKDAANGITVEAQDIEMGALVHEAIAASSLFLQRFDLEIVVRGAENLVP